MTIVLARGSKGAQVEELQAKLKKLGFYRFEPDGKFGKGTLKAVRAFQQRFLVDGIADAITQRSIIAAVQAIDGEGGISFNVPDGLGEVKATYGEFSYAPDTEQKWGKKGWVIIEDAWIDEYIIDANLPIVGTKKINKMIEEPLRTVLQLVVDRGLDGEIKQFACWAPRHKMHNPKRSLSTHSWACAVDINWDTNGVGTGEGDLDPGIVQAFELHGWVWGGRWRTSDPMHFQLCTSY